jgi:hypothetical protein
MLNEYQGVFCFSKYLYKNKYMFTLQTGAKINFIITYLIFKNCSIFSFVHVT